MGGALICEPCTNYNVQESHISSKKHVENVKIVHDFVEYCDLRAICPVVSSTRDVNFYLEMVYLKGKSSSPAPGPASQVCTKL